MPVAVGNTGKTSICQDRASAVAMPPGNEVDVERQVVAMLLNGSAWTMQTSPVNRVVDLGPNRFHQQSSVCAGFMVLGVFVVHKI